MHEYSIAEALVRRADELARERGGVAVQSLVVRLGVESGVEPELFDRAFSLARAGSLCERAELTIESVPVRWACPGCGAPPSFAGPPFCHPCGTPARLVAGDEIELRHMEIEVNDV